MSDIRKNDILELDITAVSNLGYGVGRTADGKVVFTPGTVTGERAEVKIIKITKGYLVGKLIKVVRPSELRDLGDKCTAPATCGGCAYRFIKYEHELELKRQNVMSEFDKVGLSDVTVLDTACVRDEHGEAVVWHYRNKAQYRFAKIGDRITAGFYASGTHRVIGNEACPLQPEIFGQIASLVCDFAAKHNISVYDEESGKGLLRHLYIRSGAGNNGEICVCLVINGNKFPNADELAEELTGKFDRVAGVVLNVNRKNSNLILGDEYITVSGKCGISDVFCGVELDVSPAAFYQVNHDAAELLCRTAADMANLKGDEHLLDLYCGIGSVGLSMAHKVRRLTGVEIVLQAVECAVRNAERAGIKNAKFLCADSADGAADILAKADELPDVVVLDPPRKGCASELLDSLTNAGINKIVYISCNPATLARDCAYLAKQGWNIGIIQPVDLFPRTGHVESVVCLSRQSTVHNMKLQPSPFEKIKSGQKTVELRLYDEKRQQIKTRDRIIFTNTATGETLGTTVVKLHRFNSFDELYKSLPLLECGYTSEDVDKAHPSDMELYYSAEEQKKYGVVGIEFYRSN